jgi:hypothetical protein
MWSWSLVCKQRGGLQRLYAKCFESWATWAPRHRQLTDVAAATTAQSRLRRMDAILNAFKRGAAKEKSEEASAAAKIRAHPAFHTVAMVSAAIQCNYCVFVLYVMHVAECSLHAQYWRASICIAVIVAVQCNAC